jgi:hypothetical protein
MRTTTKVRKDGRGLFVRTDGQVFRPVLSRHAYPVFQPAYIAAAEKDRTPNKRMDRTWAFAPDPDLFKAGDAVAARHVSQTPYARITAPDGRVAIWWGHGEYIGPNGCGAETERAWKPKE